MDQEAQATEFSVTHRLTVDFDLAGVQELAEAHRQGLLHLDVTWSARVPPEAASEPEAKP